MTTAAASTNPIIRFFNDDIVSPIKSFFGSEVGLTATEFVATGAGIASSLAVIEEANPSDKAGIAEDVFALSSAAYALLAGSNSPSLSTIQGAFIALKSNAKTTSFAGMATTLSAALYNYLQKYSGTPWIQVATWYVYGWQLTAQVMGGAALPSVPTSLPTEPLAKPAIISG